MGSPPFSASAPPPRETWLSALARLLSFGELFLGAEARQCVAV